MKMKILYLLHLTLINAFVNLNKNSYIHSRSNINNKLYNKNLKRIDDEINKIKLRTNILLKYKQRLLKDITGIDFHNDTVIDSYMNNTFLNDVQKQEDDQDENDQNHDNYEPDNEYGYENKYNDYDLESIPIKSNNPNIKFIFYNPPSRSNKNENQNKKNQNQNEKNKNAKSENFEVIKNNDFKFKDIGGYDLIKEELLQCSDMLINYDKYSKYNVRTPKGLILEGPPGNGKTLLAKGFSGEIDVGFIPVSGSQFQEKYVGVGSARIRELFNLARENVPCIIFMDEIDAIGRKRSGDENAGNEHDSTLNELLVSLDGFKSTNGIFVMGGTNRIDLLDNALLRPGRIDKKIYVGNPDVNTREKIIEIHIKGKPCANINIKQIVEITNGYSGAQIENLLNEAMLYVIRQNREIMTLEDIEITSNKILVGFQSTQHILSDDVLLQVATHEMGHALVGILTKSKKLIKVTINLWSPNTLGFTLFESNTSQLITKDNMICEIMTLLGGRVAEEIMFNSLSTGASHDFIQAKKISEKMVIDYGMSTKMIIPEGSDRYREIIDNEIDSIITLCYQNTKILLMKEKQLLKECSDKLFKDHILREEDIQQIKNKI